MIDTAIDGDMVLEECEVTIIWGIEEIFPGDSDN